MRQGSTAADPPTDPAGPQADPTDPPMPHACREATGLIRRLSALHETGQRGGARRPISESWRRSWDAGIDVEVASAPLVYDRDVIADARAAHPLDPHLPMLRDLLRQVADEAEHIMVITDAEGHALWSDGPAPVRRKAERIGLTEGFCWSEGSVGTNGIGTALATGRPQYVYAAEHVARILHRWSCVGAPITDPDSGAVIGCIDVSATVEVLHPATLALVSAAARLTEAHLEMEMRRRDEVLRERGMRHLKALRGERGVLVTPTGRVLAGDPADWHGVRLAAPTAGEHVTLPDGRSAVAEPAGELFLVRSPAPPGSVVSTADAGAADGPGADGERPLLTLSLLGTDRPYARVDGRRVPLSLRHAEIVALLALHPDGLTGDRLSLELYGEDGSPVTIRAEIHRLRAQLGDLVRAKPYRLECEVDADFLAVRRLLEENDVTGAARLWRGGLLPRSDAPALRIERDELSARMRRQVLDRGGNEVLWTYAQTEPGRDDYEVLERLANVLPPGDPRLGTVASRLHEF
ncbi:GAF domain-containing protein [Spirillospora sp. NPDC047279]|uniref:GAF domain-containing protein n=1 Tax=Spirillospora sp. NPDC047279 TaxID=3155478 RepID=UPI0033C4A63A